VQAKGPEFRRLSTAPKTFSTGDERRIARQATQTSWHTFRVSARRNFASLEAIMALSRTLFVCVAVMVVSKAASATVINFDDLPPIENNLQAGSTYDPIGVHISTMQSIPNTIDAVGETFTATLASDTFWLIPNTNAISDPNFAAATNGGAFDVLFSFAAPIVSLSLQTDDAGLENPDVVRLLALRSLGGNQYEVIAVDDGLDDATNAPGNFLIVAEQGFSFAMFQTTTEQEGFDNITFQAVPEPATIGLLGSGLVAAYVRARRRRSRT
jgi:hypothetical protein